MIQKYENSYLNSNNILQLIDYDKKHNNYININKVLSQVYTEIIKLNCIVFSFLLKLGFDPNIPDEHGVYLLQYALFLNAYNFIHHLIQSDKIVLKLKIPIIPFESNGEIYNIKYCHFFLQESSSVKILAKYRTTYLHLAAKCSNKQIFKNFIDKKIYDVNEVDDLGNTPLIEACKSKRRDNIALLFELDDLDYMHCNKRGQNTLEVMVHSLKEEDKAIQSKQEYLKKLMNYCTSGFNAPSKSHFPYFLDGRSLPQYQQVV